jgi:hypothetical protein
MVLIINEMQFSYHVVLQDLFRPLEKEFVVFNNCSISLGQTFKQGRYKYCLHAYLPSSQTMMCWLDLIHAMYVWRTYVWHSTNYSRQNRVLDNFTCQALRACYWVLVPRVPRQLDSERKNREGRHELTHKVWKPGPWGPLPKRVMIRDKW